jgi:hypothetical protein
MPLMVKTVDFSDFLKSDKAHISRISVSRLHGHTWSAVFLVAASRPDAIMSIAFQKPSDPCLVAQPQRIPLSWMFASSWRRQKCLPPPKLHSKLFKRPNPSCWYISNMQCASWQRHSFSGSQLVESGLAADWFATRPEILALLELRG